MIHMDGAKKGNHTSSPSPLVAAATRRNRKKTASSATSTVRWASKIKQALSLQISMLSCGLRQASRANPNSSFLLAPSASSLAINSIDLKQLKKKKTEEEAEEATNNPTVLVSSSSSPPQLSIKQTPAISRSSREESDILSSDHGRGDVLSEVASDERIIAEVPSTINIGRGAAAAAIEAMSSPTSSACSSSREKIKDANLSMPWPSPIAEISSAPKNSEFFAIPDSKSDSSSKAKGLENTKKNNHHPMKGLPKEPIMIDYEGLKPLAYATSSSSSSSSSESHDEYEEEQYEEDEEYYHEYEEEGEEGEEEEGDRGEKEEQMRDLRDLEEFIECYRRLSCPQYRELVDHFFNDLCNELMQPLGSDNSFLTLALFRVSQMCSLNL